MIEKKIDIIKASLESIGTTGSYSIPTFQRPLVWKNNMKIDLISSLKKGYPIGALTLYIDEKDSFKRRHLIDGLQRVSTIREYFTTPSNIFTWNKMIKSDLFNYQELSNEIDDNFDLKRKNKNQIKKSLRNWYEQKDRTKNSSFWDYSSLLEDFLQEFGLQYFKYFNKVLSNFINMFNLSKQEIPMIVYTGDWNDVADIFEKMNTGSVRLSKYQSLAAVWDKFIVKDYNTEYNSYLKLQYINLAENYDYDISSLEFDGGMTISEYFIAISNKLATNKYFTSVFYVPKTINNPVYLKINNLKVYKKYDVDNVSFELISTLFCGNPTRIDKYIKEIYRNSNELNSEFTVYFEKLINIILNIFKEISQCSIVKKYNKKIVNYFSIYVVAALLKIRYKIDMIEYIIEKRDYYEQSNNIKQFILDIDSKVNNSWFVGEHRQVNFLVNRIKDIDDIIEGDITMLNKFNFDEENSDL